MKEKVNNLVLFDKVRVPQLLFLAAREKKKKEEGGERSRPRFPSNKTKNTHLVFSFSPPPPLATPKNPSGHLRQAHPGGPQVQDDHPLDPLRPPPHQRLARARRDPPPRRRGREQADRRVAPPRHLHEGDQRLSVLLVFFL